MVKNTSSWSEQLMTLNLTLCVQEKSWLQEGHAGPTSVVT